MAAFRGVLEAIPFVAAVPCALLAPVFVLTIPGDPATAGWQTAYWLVLWVSLAAYPLTMAIMVGRLWRNRSKQVTRDIRGRPWTAFALMVAIWSPILVMFAHQQILAAERRANMPIERKLEYAVRHGSLDEVRALVEGGADVNTRLFNDGTAAQFAAERGEWDMVVWLLDRGARIDHDDRMGWSLRRAVAQAPEETDPERAASLAIVRSMVAAARGAQ